MAKKNTFPKEDKEKTLIDVMSHYTMWTEDSDIRRIRENGWDDITDAYWGRLPEDWPYNTKVVDPRIRTSLLEKNARLLNAKLRGRLVPREGGDMIKARINNAILDYQWDNAQDGGTMLEKWGSMDMDTRLYASKFGLTKWKHLEVIEDGKKKVLFDGNEFHPLDLRDCGLDPSCSHIRDARWFQSREWIRVDDLDTLNDVSSGEPMYPGLEELKKAMMDKSDRRDNAFENRVLHSKGLTDRVGDDSVYQIAEIVTEYRPERWITFSPRYKIILRDIPNPYKHRKIPVVQLRYYPIQGDPIGESEVEPVIPIWRAIQATVCGYLDNMNIHMRPPVKILDGAARIETIVFDAEAQWIVDRVDAVTEFSSNGEAMRYFQTTYQALVSAFNTAMGDISQGVSAVDPSTEKKTATEIKQSFRQQNVRDQKNQGTLTDTITDMMSMWLSNNQQFLFADEEKKEHIIRIVGSDLFDYFKRAGLADKTLPPEAMQVIGDVISQRAGDVSDGDIEAMIEAGSIPKYPVFENPKEKNPENLKFKSKMNINEDTQEAELSVVPEDLDGTYDYIPSVKSMAAGAEQELMAARQKAFEMIVSNPNVLALLNKEGVEPNVKDMIIDMLENDGLRDADRYFRQMQQQPQLPQGQPGQVPQMGQPGPQLTGMEGMSGQTPPQPQIPEQPFTVPQ